MATSRDWHPTRLDVLQRVAAAGSDESVGPGDGQPKLPVLLEQVTVRAL